MATAIPASDPLDRTVILEANLNLVHWQLHQMRIQRRHPDYEDLYQEGCLALWQAVQVWDPNRGALSTLAIPYIRNAIRHVTGSGRPARSVPAMSLETVIAVTEKGKPLTVAEVVARMDDGYALAEFTADWTQWLAAQPQHYAVIRAAYTTQARSDRTVAIGKRLGCSQVHATRKWRAARQAWQAWRNGD